MGQRPEFRDPRFWEKHSNRFLLYAIACMSRRPFRGSYHAGPADAEARDYVTSAAIAILDGSRNCPEHISSVAFVLGVIRSLVSHAGETPENRSPHDFIDDAAFDDSRIAGRAPAAPIDEKVAADELARKFLKVVPERYRAYVKVLMSGRYRTAEERAQALGITVARVRQLDKNVRRLRSQWEGREPRPKKTPRKR